MSAKTPLQQKGAALSASIADEDGDFSPDARKHDAPGANQVQPRLKKPAPLQARVNSGPATVTGEANHDEVEAIFSSIKTDLRACYLAALEESPRLESKFQLAVHLTAAGSLGEVGAVVTPAAPTLRACVLGLVDQVKFPAAREGFATVNYPVEFVLVPQDG